MSAANKIANEAEDSVIRIKAGRVEQLMDMVGQLSLATDAVLHHPKLKGLDTDEINNAGDKLHAIIRELQDLTSSLRLVTIESVFRRMQRLARDLSKQTGKKFNFEIQGENTEIDKVVVDTLSDPLVHLIRNSVDHGLETNEARAECGKTEPAKISLSAKQEGGDIYISIEDNGAGLNREKILARAIDKGLVRENENLSDDQVWNLIFHPGFSTKEDISQLSGRGVGMDVVKTTIDYLRGKIEIKTKLGQGTRIQLIIPLSVAFMHTMVIENDKKLFAIAVDSILEVFQPPAEDYIQSSAGQIEQVRVRDKLIPIQPLASLHRNTKPFENHSSLVFVILKTFEGAIAIPVEKVLGQYQVTVKALTGYLKDIHAVSGCALLSSGDVAWVLDPTKMNAGLQVRDMAS